MLPAAPGFVGNYHYACVLGLKFFGIGEAAALSQLDCSSLYTTDAGYCHWAGIITVARKFLCQRLCSGGKRKLLKKVMH